MPAMTRRSLFKILLASMPAIASRPKYRVWARGYVVICDETHVQHEAIQIYFASLMSKESH